MILLKRGLLLIAVIFLSGCSAFFASDTRSGSSSSLVDFLYPKGEIPPALIEQTPVLHIPVDVGLAFIPSRGYMQIAESEKAALLERVKNAFSDREYIGRIEVIPSTYLSNSKGFDGLEQIGRLYDVDVMALVSHDQVVAASDTTSSMLYWTIVGAYIIKGTENEVTTFVDTAVFDLNTHRMLLRAPGLNEVSKQSTALDVGKTGRELSSASFDAAMEQMTANLDTELELFKERIEQDQSVRLVSKSGSGGSGSVDGLLLLLIGLGLLKAVRSSTR